MKPRWDLVTLEPMLFLKMTAEGIFKIVADNLEIERICNQRLNISKEICDVMDNGNHTEIQNEVQREQADFNYVQTLMDSYIPLIMIIILGPLSDRYGRKPPMIMVLLGFIGLSFVYMLTAMFPDFPVESLYLGTLAVDLGGTWVVFNMAVYSYIADITTTSNRTKRLGIADAIWYSGSPLGTFLGGIIYKYGGYVAVYATSGVLWVISLIYLILFVKESNQNTSRRNTRWSPIQHVKDLFGVIFKKRRFHGRPIIIALLAIKLLNFLVQGHTMLKWARKVLQWDPLYFSTWVSAENASHQLGMVIWLLVAETIGLHNCLIAASGVFSIMLWSITLAFITGPSMWWLTIVASLLGLLEACIEPALRSMMTIIVGIGEEGSIFTANGLLESGWLSVDGLIYTQLYKKYVSSFPQINFTVQAAICVPLILFILILYKVMIKFRPPPLTENEIEDENEI